MTCLDPCVSTSSFELSSLLSLSPPPALRFASREVFLSLIWPFSPGLVEIALRTLHSFQVSLVLLRKSLLGRLRPILSKYYEIYLEKGDEKDVGTSVVGRKDHERPSSCLEWDTNEKDWTDHQGTSWPSFPTEINRLRFKKVLTRPMDLVCTSCLHFHLHNQSWRTPFSFVIFVCFLIGFSDFPFYPFFYKPLILKLLEGV